MSLIRARDVAYVRFRAPDLARMQAFLEDFGMVAAAPASGDRLFMRGCGPGPFVHVTERGEPGFAGFGLWAPDLKSLEALARAENVAVEPLGAPAGGHVARLTDPDGHTVEVVAGQTAAAALPVPHSGPWNQAGGYPRQGAPRQVAAGPSHVLRLGHVVLSVSDFRASERWYKDRFGFLTSDEIQPEPGVAVGAFMRCDRGDAPCDHHTVFLLQHPKGPGFLHAAFEVHDLDDLMAGHAHLLSVGAKPRWGVGRHRLGSQIFDYWQDPWGHEIEHWTDGDQLDAGAPPGVAGFDQLIGVHWGPPFPG